MSKLVKTKTVEMLVSRSIKRQTVQVHNKSTILGNVVDLLRICCTTNPQQTVQVEFGLLPFHYQTQNNAQFARFVISLKLIIASFLIATSRFKHQQQR